jgi:DNA mismatch repair ATPase MutL
MENEELTDDLEVETQDEAVEDDQGSENDGSQDTNTLTESQELAKAKADAAKYRRLFEKSQKGTAVAEPQTATPTQSVNVEEIVLKAQGMPDELLKKLKAVASLEGTSLIDAQTNDLFVAAKEKFEKDIRAQKATVGASRGSGAVPVKKTLATPNLTKEEHMRLVKGK